MAYTIKEVASKLSISIKSARRLVASGEIEAKKMEVFTEFLRVILIDTFQLKL